MDIAVGFAAIILLILANGWFVLAEFAFVAARRPQLEERAEQGDRRARRALGILGRLSFMLSGAQFGITVTSLLVGFIAEPVFSRAVAPLVDGFALAPETRTGIAIALGLILSTTAQMVFGELAPKNLGIARPERFSGVVAGGMRIYLLVAGPVIALFDGASNRLLKALGIEPAQELSGGVSPEELGLIIAESGRGGVLTSSQTALLGRLLEFRTLRAADAMVPRRQVVFLSEDASCRELQDAAVRSGHSRFPVTSGEDLDDVTGVVLAKDVFRVPSDERADHQVGALMADPLVVPESAQLGPILTDMRRSRATLAVVIDEYGGTAGVLTLEDIVEEIVGQIRDEYDREEPAVVALPGGAFLAPGSWRPGEVTRDTGLELPTGDYETVSGLVMERLGRVPRSGDTVELDGLRIQVVAMDGLAVGRVRLVPTPASRADDAGERP